MLSSEARLTTISDIATYVVRFACEERGERPLPRTAIARGPRVGIDYAERWAAMPWRFWIRGNPFVSRPHGARV